MLTYYKDPIKVFPICNFSEVRNLRKYVTPVTVHKGAKELLLKSVRQRNRETSKPESCTLHIQYFQGLGLTVLRKDLKTFHCCSELLLLLLKEAHAVVVQPSLGSYTHTSHCTCILMGSIKSGAQGVGKHG